MLRFTHLPAMLVAAAALLQTASAQIVYTMQYRRLTIGTNGSVSDLAFAPGFGSFVQAISDPIGGMNASMNSTLGSAGIVASGTAQATGGTTFANSSHDVTFTIAQPVVFSGPVFTLGSGSIMLDGPGGHWELSGGQSGQWSGVFLPGTYQLRASAESTGADSVFNLNLQTRLASVFTYQGSLSRSGVPAQGPHTLRFSLYNAASGGSKLGSTVDVPAVQVDQGLFTTQIGFEKQYLSTSEDRWLEITVIGDDGNETVLSPRQQIARAPFASVAASADQAAAALTTPWTGVSDVPTNVANAFSPWQHYYGDPFDIYFPSGDVAIGDTTPVAPLTIRGTGTNNEWLAFNSGISTTRWHINGGSGGTSFNLAETGVADYRLAVRPGGKVGVNGLPALSGAAQFTVFGADGTTGAHIESRSAANLGLSFHTFASPTTSGMYQDPNGQLRFTSNFVGAPTTWTSLGFNGAWTVQSDRRCKKDITPVSGLLEKALKLEPVSYFYNGQDLALRPDRSIGLIAQDVEKLFPEFVTGRGEQMRAIDYAGLSVVAIGAIRELHDQIAAQQSSLNAMRAEIEALKAAAASSSPRQAAAH